MRTRQSANVPRVLSTTRRQFEQWRPRQHGRKRLPKELWEKAVALAREHGINQTAHTLGLKYNSLKKHLDGATPDAGNPGRAKPDFIELLPGGLTSPSPECTIEWEDGHGGKIRMHVKGIGVPDLVSFARLFRSGPA
jgi:signal recognition particle subunit SEC65